MKYEVWLPGLCHEIKHLLFNLNVEESYHPKRMDWVDHGEVFASFSLSEYSEPSTINSILGKPSQKKKEFNFKFASPVSGRVAYTFQSKNVMAEHYTNWWRERPRSVPTRQGDLLSKGYILGIVTEHRPEIRPIEVYGEFLTFLLSNKKLISELTRESPWSIPENWHDAASKEYEFFEKFPCPVFTEDEVIAWNKEAFTKNEPTLSAERQALLDKTIARLEEVYRLSSPSTKNIHSMSKRIEEEAAAREQKASPLQTFVATAFPRIDKSFTVSPGSGALVMKSIFGISRSEVGLRGANVSRKSAVLPFRLGSVTVAAQGQNHDCNGLLATAGLQAAVQREIDRLAREKKDDTIP